MFRRPLANLLSASTAELGAVPAPSPAAPRVTEAADRWMTPKRFYLGLLVAALIVGALSLLIPSTPSYDPWAWVVWGREIVHLDLQTTGGPSWKPLPVIFTTLFAPLHSAAPDLWLIVARAGAVAAVAMVFRLSVRLTRQIAGRPTGPESGDRAGAVTVGPALLAGLIAAFGLIFTYGFISNNALGYSEGVATAVILIAVERHLDGSPRQAFAFGFVAALDRPEIWLFWGPYGLYLWWRDPGARKLVLGLFLVIPVLWFLPEYWGSGHFLRGVSRAQHPRSNSEAFANCPFCSELIKGAWPTILLRIKVAAALLVIVVTALVGRGGLRGRAAALSPPRARAQVAAAGAGLVGLSWFVVIAVMTQIGFSGNNRYLVIGAALVEICGAVAWGWAAREVGALGLGVLGRRRAASRPGLARATATVAVLGVAAAFVFLPPWVVKNLAAIPRTHRALVYQAHLRQGVSALVARYGGAARLLRCGTVMTEGFQVPMVAWTLGVHTLRVEGPAAPGQPPGPAPNVILQTRASRNLALLPAVRAWPGTRYTYAGRSGPFRLFTHCHG